MLTTPSIKLAAAPLLALLASTAATPRAPETIRPNDNQHAAGALANHGLTVELEARTGVWYPEGEAGRALDAAAFAEGGKPLWTPGPLILSFESGDKPITWRPVAQDGYALPASQATERPATMLFDPGEIYDFEYTRRAPGELALRFGYPPLPPGSPPPPAPVKPPPAPVKPPPPPVTVAVHVR